MPVTNYIFFNPARLQQAQAWAVGWTPNLNDVWDRGLAYLLKGDVATGQGVMNASAGIDFEGGGYADNYRAQDNLVPNFNWCYAAGTADQIAAFETRYGGPENFPHYGPLQYFQARFNDGQTVGGSGNEFGNYFAGFFGRELTYAWITNNATLYNWTLTNRWNALVTWFNNNPGGVPPEGSEYGIAYYDYLVLPLLVSADFGGPGLGRDIAEETLQLIQAGWYLYYSSFTANGTGQYFPFADDEHNNGFPQIVSIGHPVTYQGNLMSFLAYKYGSTAIGKTAWHWVDRWQPLVRNYLKSVYPTADPGAPPVQPLDYFAPSGHAICRSSWDPAGMILHLQLTRGPGGHNHYDGGTCQAVFNGAYVMKETTCYETAISDAWGGKDTVLHNSIAIGGSNDTNGRRDNQSRGNRGAGTILRVQSAPAFFQCATDLTDCYRSNDSRLDNPHVLSHIREVVFIRSVKSWVVRDTIQTDDGSVPRMFCAHSTPAWNGMVGSNGMLKVYSVLPTAKSIDYVDETPTPPDSSVTYQNRLQIHATDGQPNTTFLTVLQARNPLDPDIIVTLDGTVLTVGTHHIDFNALTFDGVPMRADIQPFIADQDGCRWLP